MAAVSGINITFVKTIDMKRLVITLLFFTTLHSSAQLFKQDAEYLKYSKCKIQSKDGRQKVSLKVNFVIKLNSKAIKATVNGKSKSYTFIGKATREKLSGKHFWRLNTINGVKVYIHIDKEIVLFEEAKNITMLYN